MASQITSVAIQVSRAPRRERGRRRVVELTAAAAALFVEKGYEATTMTEIAARAGASIGSLYLFFPTKPLLAQTMLTELADRLSTQLEALRVRSAGWPAAAIADGLFAELSRLLATDPVYGVLADMGGNDAWRQAIRARRRHEIGALFAQAAPPLAAGQPERLAVIVPQLMRMILHFSAEPLPLQAPLLEELRAMLRHHLSYDRE